MAPPTAPADDRLDSWKEIAAYLKRDVTTAQRWEKRERMPVHRHLHDKVGSVYAFKSELDAWAAGRRAEDPEPGADLSPPPTGFAAPWPVERRRSIVVAVTLAGAVLSALLVLWAVFPSRNEPGDVLAGARYFQLTDFGGNEHAAALSRDGRHVAFLSDRAGRMDLWVGQVGSGQFYNLTEGTAPELVNPSLRTLGFSPDGALVTFWARRMPPSGNSDINIWSMPVLGGAQRPYLEGIAEFDWSPDGSRLVYHTPGPGDPMFVRDAPESDAHQIFAATAGLHAHFPVWSRDGRFIYFVQGTLPEPMDIWRIAATGGTPERLTFHGSRVSHPVLVTDRTLLYLATDQNGGPWLYSMDVERRQARRISSGVERYTSLAASADATRVVVTSTNPRGTLWRLPFGDRVDVAAGGRLPLTTVSGSSPRMASGYVLYVATKGESQSIWKLQEGRPTELWTGAATRIIGAPAVTRDGHRIAFITRRDERTSLLVTNADGTNARTLATGSLQLQGTPAWSPDGRMLTVSAEMDGVPRLFNVSLDGGDPVPLVSEHATEPMWSPDGRLLVYSGPDVGTTFQVKAVTADGRAASFPAITLSRGSRHVCFTPDGRALIVLRGEIAHKDLWTIDLQTGHERQLSQLASDFNVRDFDVSPDGREVVLEQVREHSDIVLIDRAPSNRP